MPTPKSMRAMRYDAKSARHYSLKLNNATDAELIQRLEAVSSVNGYIRRLIREDIERNPQLPADDRKPFDPETEA